MTHSKAVTAAAQQDRERDQTRKRIREARRLRRALLSRVIRNAPSEELRRQAQLYLDRLDAGRQR